MQANICEMRSLWFLPLVCLCLCGNPPTAQAQGQTSRIGSPTASFTVGPALMLHSKSKALSQFIQPMATLSVRWAWRARFGLGAQLLGLLNTNENYRVLGGLATGRYQLWQRGVFSTGISAGVGIGDNAHILNSDLRGGGLAGYATAGLDGRWLVLNSVCLGFEIDTLNLATARLAGTATYVF